MVFVPAPLVCEFVWRWNYHGKVVSMVFDILKEDEWVDGDDNGVVAAINNAFLSSGLYDALSSDVTGLVDNVSFQRQLAESEPTYYVTSANSPGAGGAGLPANVAYVITKRTGVGGRSYRGRTYIPSIPESAVTLDEVGSTFRDIVDDWGAAMLTALAALDPSCALAVVSRFSKVENPVAPHERAEAISSVVTSYVTRDATVDTRRKRL